MKKIELTKDEMTLLIGGLLSLAKLQDDILNKNSIAGCNCTYNNRATITNDNSVDSCRCTCI